LSRRGADRAPAGSPVSALIVVHNHPSGNPKPSRDDIETTLELKAAAKALEIELRDHVVIGHVKHASFKSLGFL